MEKGNALGKDAGKKSERDAEEAVRGSLKAFD